MTAGTAPHGSLYELGRFLEIQTVGLNLPFALAFLFLAAGGIPSLWVVFLVVVAFVSARNAGHSFNRWADRDLDAANPRTRDRAIPSGRRSPASALAITVLSGAVLLIAAYLLNPLAFVLAPVALAIVLGYSYTKRFTAFTTPFLGFVQAVTPGAVFIAVQGRLAWFVLLAVAGLLFWVPRSRRSTASGTSRAIAPSISARCPLASEWRRPSGSSLACTRWLSGCSPRSDSPSSFVCPTSSDSQGWPRSRPSPTRVARPAAHLLPGTVPTSLPDGRVLPGGRPGRVVPPVRAPRTGALIATEANSTASSSHLGRPLARAGEGGPAPTVS